MNTPPWLDKRMAPNGRRVRENFIDWFGGSRVVDDAGLPLMAFHGTGADVDEFDLLLSGRNYGLRYPERALYLTSNPVAAGIYAEQAALANFADESAPRFGRGTANVMPVYVRLERPYVRKAQGSPDKWIDSRHSEVFGRARDIDADGIIVTGGKGFEHWRLFIAFSAEQVKSALGNPGLFLKNSASITDHAQAQLLLRARRASSQLQEAPSAPLLAPW